MIKNFKKEITTVWSFPKRGKWSLHNSKYPGNFAPQVARNVILRYSKEGDKIIDPMVGSGTSIIESGLLGRRGVGIDIYPKAIKMSKRSIKKIKDLRYDQSLFIGDARKLDKFKTSTFDLIITHPPYLDIINYSKGNIKGDLSNISDVNEFLFEFRKIIKEFYRILKPNSHCAILIGDTRKSKHYVPLSYYILNLFLENGFVLKEEIVKIQHNCSSTPYWRSKINKYNFLLIMHEHLFIFRKPKRNENLEKIKYSTGI